ncbi:hypothetical protein [Microcoleus sp. CAWBG640]|uniref:hypothetical protein n=1 Tax=Microcoleus sp. CAWBG640 TaxID=2841653 RepID=UPI00312BBB69
MVFGVKGDRSFILDDRASEKKRAIALFYSSIATRTIIAVFGIWCEWRSLI